MKKKMTFVLILVFLVGLFACKPDDNEKTDQEKVDSAKASLDVGYLYDDSSSSVTKNVTLSTTKDEVTITWESDNEEIINTNGVVTQPFDEDVTVTLIATLKLNEASAIKTFVLTVKKTDEEYDITKRTALNENEIKYTFESRDSYENPIEITDQWGGTGANRYAYGIGDPFVMRHNGKYYLYPSTQDGQRGIRVYESDDMVNWVYKGFAVSNTDETSRGAYAPEVIYYQGYFYLCQSKGGTGHYFYRADNPLGPFERITGNLGRGIDGSFHINDDGKLYLLHTAVPAGLRMSEILKFPETLDETGTGVLGPQRLIETANLNHWIEGPGTIRRDDITYLTYTGNHVGSIGYRVAYSYTMGNMFTNTDFIQPANNVTLISTKSDYSGLGHSSDAFGPNLDSIYTAYHNRSNYGRRYNLDQYLTNGIRLTSNAAYNNFGTIPKRPDFEATDSDGLTKDILNFYLSDKITKDYYTAEFNYIVNNGEIILNYQNETNHLKIRIDETNNTIALVQIKNGNSSILKSASLGDGNNYESLTEIRVEKSLTKFRIYYNEMLKLEVDYEGEGGKIGYTGNAVIKYTAFQNDVNGSSDFEVVHAIPSNIPAQSYLKEADRGYHFYGSNLTNNAVRNGEENNIVYKDDQYAVLLNTKNDYVKYPIEGKNNTYSLVAEITKESLGSIIEIVLGEEEIIKVDVPKDIVFPEGVEYVPVHLVDLNISGQTTIKFRLFRGSFEFRQFQLYEDAEMEELNNLNGQAILDETRQVAAGRYTVNGDSIESNTSQIFMGLLGNSGVANFEYTVDVAIMNSSISDGGIVFRAKNYSFHNDQPTQSFQGYYLKIQERAGTLYKYDYGSDTIKSIALIDGEGKSLFTQGTFNTIKVICYNNNLQIFINGIEYMNIDISDQLMDGQVGFFSRNTGFAYKNVSYKIL